MTLSYFHGRHTCVLWSLRTLSYFHSVTFPLTLKSRGYAGHRSIRTQIEDLVSLSRRVQGETDHGTLISFRGMLGPGWCRVTDFLLKERLNI